MKVLRKNNGSNHEFSDGSPQVDAGSLRLSVAGPFRLTTPMGKEINVSERKAQGLIALLALSEARTRTREYLIDHLWSRSDRASGSASLRSCLSKVRRELLEWNHLLTADSRLVRLSSEIECDIEWSTMAVKSISGISAPVLLDGLMTRDPVFDNWLSKKRDLLREKFNRSVGNSNIDAYYGHSRNQPAWIMLSPPDLSAPQEQIFLAHVLGETIARGIGETASVDVSSYPRDYPGLLLQTRVITGEKRANVHISIKSTHSHTLLWSITDVLPMNTDQLIITPQFSRLTNQAIDIALAKLRDIGFETEHGRSSVLCIDAIHRMFKLDPEEITRADKLLDEAFELNPRGIYLAWKAYIRNFFIGERLGSDFPRYLDEAKYYAKRSLELEPYNATALALLSHVHCFLLKDPALGHELAERALQFSPSHPLAMAYLGQAKIHLGQFDVAYELSKAALQASGPGPHYYSLVFQNCMAAAANNDVRRALEFGLRAHALEPHYRPPMRYIFGLALNIGDRAQAQTVFEEMRALEADFSLSLLKEPTYPVAGLRVAGLLELDDDEF